MRLLEDGFRRKGAYPSSVLHSADKNVDMMDGAPAATFDLEAIWEIESMNGRRTRQNEPRYCVTLEQSRDDYF